MGTSPAGGGTAGRPAARPRRRGSGPEASSATATIVAVTMSDSAAPAGSTAAEYMLMMVLVLLNKAGARHYIYEVVDALMSKHAPPKRRCGYGSRHPDDR